METLAHRLKKLGSDRRSGSSTIAARFCRICLSETRSPVTKMSHAAIAEALGDLITEFPTMALLRTLQDRLQRTTMPARSPARPRHDIVAQALEQFLRELASNRTQAAERFAQSASGCRSLLTLSSSGAVLAACVALNANKPLRRSRKFRPLEMIVCESRPACEGVVLARRLSRAGCRVIVITDAAIGGWIEKVDAVILGADWIDRRGFVNKTGSRAASLLGGLYGKPVYVIGDTLRVRRQVFPLSHLPLYESTARARHRGGNLLALSAPFERVEWQPAHLLVTESRVSRPARDIFTLS